VLKPICLPLRGLKRPRRKKTILHKLPVRARSTDDPIFKEAFPVLDANNILKDIVSTLPNKRRLTPLSIMVCDTISEKYGHVPQGSLRSRINHDLYIPQVSTKTL
jgi:hypothetical protein